MKVTELNHQIHPAGVGGTQARIEFSNGYGASVVSGPLCFTNNEQPWEIAIIDSAGYILYDTPITSGVCDYLTNEEANKILAQIEALPHRENKS